VDSAEGHDEASQTIVPQFGMVDRSIPQTMSGESEKQLLSRMRLVAIRHGGRAQPLRLRTPILYRRRNKISNAVLILIVFILLALFLFRRTQQAGLRYLPPAAARPR
jgi:hypothetical protein